MISTARKDALAAEPESAELSRDKPTTANPNTSSNAGRQIDGGLEDESQVPSMAIALNRLANASRQAAKTTSLANDLAGDPDFKAWLHQLAELHETSAQKFQRLLETEGAGFHQRFGLSGSIRRCLMRCLSVLTEASDFALMDGCRREEYRVQSAYELALWVLPDGSIRETVEDRFQQFVLHRSMIPVRRLPQTRQFLQQAERLQQIHSTSNHEGASHVSHC